MKKLILFTSFAMAIAGCKPSSNLSSPEQAAGGFSFFSKVAFADSISESPNWSCGNAATLQATLQQLKCVPWTITISGGSLCCVNVGEYNRVVKSTGGSSARVKVTFFQYDTCDPRSGYSTSASLLQNDSNSGPCDLMDNSFAALSYKIDDGPCIKINKTQPAVACKALF